ncbi:MAG: class I SAM-dependent RNA methyltransferase [Bacilli bacterium]|nr:class I SAM-dependent RNA methyltransferase [Bacilli bacterium]
MNIKTIINNLNYEGKGISKHNDKVIFISNALPEEEVELKIIETNKRYDIGEVIKYNSFSSDRVETKCPYYNECGGCNISHMNYDAQLNYKQNKLIDILKRYSDLTVTPNVIKSNNDFYYRNKITLKVINGLFGYYKSKSHKLLEIKECMIASKSINKILEQKDLLYIKNGELIIRSNYKDEILIIINTSEEIDIKIKELLDVSNIVGIIVNGEIIYGLDFFYEKRGDYTFKVDYKSFFQVNNYILDAISEILNKNEYKTVVDLYCGVGVLGSFINFNKLYGIEVSDSLKDAKYNSKMNDMINTKYIQGDSSRIKDIEEEIDLLIIDPPRKGIDNKTLENILEKNPNNIIYMSCDPMSLARDLNKLKNVYDIKESYVLDMFPQTHHVETVVLMSKVEK